MEIITSLFFVLFGFIRLYWVNRTYLRASELIKTKGRLLDARVVENNPSFYYQYKVDDVLIGGRAFDTFNKEIAIHKMKEVFSGDISPDNPKDIDVFYIKNNPLLSVIKVPSWQLPFDSLFLIIVPITYLIIEAF